MKTMKKVTNEVILKLSTEDVANLIMALQETHNKMIELTKDNSICMPTILADLEDQLNMRYLKGKGLVKKLI
jgi:hypothetical protein